MKTIKVTASCECPFRHDVDTGYKTEAGTWMDDVDTYCNLLEKNYRKVACAGFLHVDCPLTHGIEIEAIDTSRRQHCFKDFCFRSDVKMLPGRVHVYACPKHFYYPED